MVELKGSLSGIGLPAILQLIGDLHHSGQLDLISPTSRGELGFDDGRLVSASFGQERGLKALAACGQQLGDADFRFVEGPHTSERTIDIGSVDLQRYLGEVMRGEVATEPVALTDVTPTQANAAPGPCPALGFADDPARHYSRPTALHRCFASGAASLATGQTQRELCLSGRYSTCPRFRAANPNVATSEPVAPPPEPSQSEPTQPASRRSRFFQPATHQPVVPAGVAARLSAASQMRLAPEAEVAGPDPDRYPPAEEDDQHPRVSIVKPPVRPRRALWLVAIGAVLGLIVLAGGLLVAWPTLQGRLAQRQTNPPAQAFEPVPTVTRAAPTPARQIQPTVAAPGATSVRTVAVPTSAALPIPTPGPVLNASPARAVSPAPTQLVPPAPVVRPTESSSTPPVVDVVFSAGPVPDWLDSPPFAAWSDGAYRVQARQIGHFVAVGVPVAQPLSDVVVSATFRKTGGPPGGGYGLLIRDQGQEPLDGQNQTLHAYVFEAGDKGEFGIWRRDGDSWVDLLPWTRSTSVRAGGSPNDLTVRAIGPHLSFTINGIEVANIEDATLDAGGVGVFVGGDNNEVALDQFTVEIPN